MTLHREKLFEVYQGNFKIINSAFSRACQAAKQSLRRNEMEQYKSDSKIAYMLFSTRTEISLFKLIYSHDNLSDTDRSKLLRSKQVITKWRELLDIAFSNRYNITISSIPHSLKDRQLSRYQDLKYYIDEYVEPLISVRNNLAHGEWLECLNSKKTNTNPARSSDLAKISIYRINFEEKIIKLLTDSLFDLIATRDAFERDADSIIKKLKLYEENFKSEPESRWNRKLQENHKKGLALRSSP